MIQTDITIVLYGFDKNDFLRTARTVEHSTESIRKIWILLSGGPADHQGLRDCLNLGLFKLPVDIEYRFDNVGFAAGHNFLLAKAFKGGASNALILNPDVSFDSDALRALLLASLRYDLCLLGPALRQLEEESGAYTDLVDSMGIGWDQSGRHFDIKQGKAWKALADEPHEVMGLTGACLLVPRNTYLLLQEKFGQFFDPMFIAYREDAELGIRASLAGVRSILVPMAGFGHVRTTRGFTRNNDFVNMLGVRNRFLIRWNLGTHRPGHWLVSAARDVLVLFAVFTVERTSRVGLRDAWRVRRSARAWRNLL